MELRDAGLLKWSQRRLIPTNRAYVTAGHRNSALLGVVLVFNNGLPLFNFAMQEDWKDLDSYARTRVTAYGSKFENVCREITGPVQREQLRRLIMDS